MTKIKFFSLVLLLTMSLSSGAQVYDYHHYVNSLSVNERNNEALKQMGYLVASCGYGAAASVGSAVWRTLPLGPALVDYTVHQRRDVKIAEVTGAGFGALLDIFYSEHYPSLFQGAFQRTRETIFNGLTGSHSPCQTAYSNLMTIRDLKLQQEAAQRESLAINDDDRSPTPRDRSRTSSRQTERRATSR